MALFGGQLAEWAWRYAVLNSFLEHACSRWRGEGYFWWAHGHGSVATADSAQHSTDENEKKAISDPAINIFCSLIQLSFRRE